ncbi:MAG: hypothetical protein HON70_37655 [Lentisphaerae bacterium]|nr:hypothetical protein [Lentisphaerota bacterium]
MDGDLFTRLVKEEARDFAIEWSFGSDSGVSKNAQIWLLQLSGDERELLREIITEAVDHSLIRLFEIMDGVHGNSSEAIEASCAAERISGKGLPQLHDLYAART